MCPSLLNILTRPTMLRPKHHYVEHYPHLIMCFVPLVHFWTMRFDGKHKVFKKIVHDVNNFKNILKMLAERHQKQMAYYLSSPAFLKPEIKTTNMKSVLVATLPEDAQAFISSITDSNTIYSADQVIIDGTLFRQGMFVCTGLHGEFP